MSTSEWIERAQSVHGDRYNYRLVHYMNRDTKVIIICPVHGEFSQRAGNHLNGKGCADCAPNRRGSQTIFLEKARAVHGGIYDYSETVFTKNAAKLIITCREHGAFEQEANSHLRGSGCPSCANGARSKAVSEHPTRLSSIRETLVRRYGVSNPMQLEAVKQKVARTMVERYGVENYRHAPDYREKYQETVRTRYGVDHYSQSDAFLEQVVETSFSRYGVANYTQSSLYRDRLPEIMEKSVATQLIRYGAPHYSQSDVARALFPERLLRGYVTKRANGSFSSSKPEDDMFDRLCQLFGVDDIERQYSDVRYPFQCDFYIRSRDMFIELNGTWTHGGHWYGSEPTDVETCETWRTKTSAYYDNAVTTWTQRDVRKRQAAKVSNLNYLVFWSPDLSDFERWVSVGSPDAKDFLREYSWS